MVRGRLADLRQGKINPHKAAGNQKGNHRGKGMRERGKGCAVRRRVYISSSRAITGFRIEGIRRIRLRIAQGNNLSEVTAPAG